MEIQTTKPAKYTFERIITREERKEIVDLYTKGTAISALARYYGIHHSSIYYHIKKAGVFRPGRNIIINFTTLKKMFGNGGREKVPKFHSKPTPEQFWPPNEKQFPKSYAEYLNQYNKRNGTQYKPNTERCTDSTITFLV